LKQLFFCALLLLASCSEKKKVVQSVPNYPVQIGLAYQKDVPLFIETLGHIDSITRIDIRSRVEGELTGVFFTQGQEVKSGDLLFTIDSKPFEAALKQAQGVLDQNLANLALAEEKVKRYRILAKDEYYSQIDYETLQANLAAGQALVKQSQAEVASAAINLDYCWIYAPIDGMMGLLNIDYGNLVAPNGDPLTTLNQMDPIYATFSIPEFQLPKIQRAYRQAELAVLAAYEDFKEEVFTGKLFMLNNAVDEKTGMIALRALFPNEQRQLWPGQFVRTRLVLSTMKNATLIPFSAVQLTQGAPIAFVVDENHKVEERKLSLGQRENDDVIVLEGIRPGEKVVTEGQINLSNGVLVHVPES
jgi:multidrug efflux system membrane fusion protein